MYNTESVLRVYVLFSRFFNVSQSLKRIKPTFTYYIKSYYIKLLSDIPNTFEYMPL